METLESVKKRVEEINGKFRIHVEREAKILDFEDLVNKKCSNLALAVPIALEEKCLHSIGLLKLIVPEFINLEFSENLRSFDMGKLEEHTTRMSSHCMGYVMNMKGGGGSHITHKRLI